MLVSVLYSPFTLGVVLVGLALMGQLVARRIAAARKLNKVNDIIGIYLTLVGAIYGIALAFVLTAAWSNQESTRELIDEEAQALGSIAFLARGLPHPDDDYVVLQTNQYASAMQDYEWPSLATGVPSDTLNLVSARLGLRILSFAPTDQRGNALDTELLSAFERLRALRGERRLKAEYRVPDAIWGLLIFGAVITLSLCYMLEVENRRLHLVQTGLVASLLAFALLITWNLQDPFRGVGNLSAEPFNHLADDRFMDEDAWRKLIGEKPDAKVAPHHERRHEGR